MRKKNKEAKSIIVILYITMLVVLITVFCILLINNNYSETLAYDSLVDKTELYSELLNRETNISRDLKIMRLKNNKELIQSIPFEASAASAEHYSLWNALQEINNQEGTRYNFKYTFFEYGYIADVMVLKETVYFQHSQRPEYIQKMIAQLRKNCEQNIEVTVWNFIRVNEVDYLFGSMQSEGKMVGCYAKVDDLIKDYHITTLGYEGFLIFEKDGELYASEATKKREEIQNIASALKTCDSERTKQYTWYTYSLNGIGNIKIVTLLSNGILDKVNVFQSILTISFCVIVGIVVYMICYLYNKVLNPMHKFVVQLQNPEEEVYLNEKDGSGPLELLYASDKFKQMYRELQSLRIDLYEKELFEKNTMLEYAQEQMKPHFFLNSMSVVQSIAELHHEEKIVQILEVLSSYMRYVLKDTFEMRHIRDEVKHLNDYMEIQSLCKPGMFHYTVEVDEDVQECEILPLVLQTLTENSIKHGLKTGRCIEISLYITTTTSEEGESLYIVISDTGNGFSQEVLDKIEQDIPIIHDGCEHIGIRNTLKRIRLKYGDKASVRFSNMSKNYGAVIELTLPLERRKHEVSGEL